MYTSPSRPDARWLACLLALVAAPAFAAQQQALPIHIASDHAELSQKSGVSTYTGNVKMTRAGLTLTGDKLVITRSNNDRKDIRAVLTGAPAHIDKQPDRDGKDVITGHSQRIRYNNEQAIIVLSGHAVVNRAGDQVTGPVITYNLNTGRTEAKRGSKSGERVRITIQPNNSNGK